MLVFGLQSCETVKVYETGELSGSDNFDLYVMMCSDVFIYVVF